MLLIHATQKLLSVSRLSAATYITAAGPDQLLHSWYAQLLSTGFPGKGLIMYVHEPSLLTVVCAGKTIKRTWPSFQQRLPALLARYGFPPPIIEHEMAMAEGYVVGKTVSRSMLAYMRQIEYTIEQNSRRFPTAEAISLDELERICMGCLFGRKEKGHSYFTPTRYWKERLSS
ncbi:MAG: hypothetical protein EOO13_10635 [Chitinophagaceae bacterium]|nr:MAG: hypothetical protein EOO13_10635 [Chitinophagaceae bacterium]